MKQTIKSELHRFKEDNSIQVENEPETTAGSEIISDMTTSQLKDIINQEIKNSSVISGNKPDSKSDPPDSSSHSEPKSHPQNQPHQSTGVRENPVIKLPSKSKNRRASRKINASWPLNIPQLYTELKPVNIKSESKSDLILYIDKRIRELLEENYNDICFISPISNNPQATPDINMKRCKALIETLKKADYMYFPVYLYDTSSKQILSIVFMVYDATVKTIKLDRTFNDLFNLMTDFSRKFLIENLVYWTNGRFVLKENKEYSYLDLDSSEEVIMCLCYLNKFKITKYCQLMVNPFCSNKLEYLERHISENELCVVM